MPMWKSFAKGELSLEHDEGDTVLAGEIVATVGSKDFRTNFDIKILELICQDGEEVEYGEELLKYVPI